MTFRTNRIPMAAAAGAIAATMAAYYAYNYINTYTRKAEEAKLQDNLQISANNQIVLKRTLQQAQLELKKIETDFEGPGLWENEEEVGMDSKFEKSSQNHHTQRDKLNSLNGKGGNFIYTVVFSFLVALVVVCSVVCIEAQIGVKMVEIFALHDAVMVIGKLIENMLMSVPQIVGTIISGLNLLIL